MNEKLWLTTDRPLPMLQHAVQFASDRQWRLLICACLRAVWDELPEKLFRVAVALAEELADGKALGRDLTAARTNLSIAALNARRLNNVDESQWADYCRHALSEAPLHDPLRLPPVDRGERFFVEIDNGTMTTRDPRQCQVIRDVFGNPFREIALDDFVLDQHASAVKTLASEIYQKRAFELMPVLGDALEDAGCEDEAMLAHCREHPEHFRGCWVLETITLEAAEVSF